MSISKSISVHSPSHHLALLCARAGHEGRLCRCARTRRAGAGADQLAGLQRRAHCARRLRPPPATAAGHGGAAVRDAQRVARRAAGGAGRVGQHGQPQCGCCGFAGRLARHAALQTADRGRPLAGGGVDEPGHAFTAAEHRGGAADSQHRVVPPGDHAD